MSKVMVNVLKNKHRIVNVKERPLVNFLFFLRLFTFLFLSSLLMSVAHSNVDSVGKEFLFAIPPNLAGVSKDGSFSDLGVDIVISSQQSTFGSVSYGDSIFRNFFVSAGKSTRVRLGSSYAHHQTPVKKVVRVIADKEVSVHVFSKRLTDAENGVSSADAFLALPTDSLGQHYIVAGFSPSVKTVDANKTHLLVAAGHDGDVELYITPQVDFDTLTKGQPHTITVPSGYKVLSFATNGDLQGQTITANGDLSIYSPSFNYGYVREGMTYTVPGKNFHINPSVFSSYISIAAPYNGTEVYITPMADFEGMPSGVPQTISLNEGESVTLRAKDVDLTGQRLESNLPISVTSAVGCATSDDIEISYRSTTCNYIVEMMPSIDTWGKNVLLHGYGSYRILAAEDDTDIFINNELVTTLNNGQFYATGSSAEVSANKPILAVGYLSSLATQPYNAPSYSHGLTMGLVPPVEQYVHNQYGFYASPWMYTSVKLIVRTEDIDSLLLDGAPVSNNSRLISNTAYSAISIAFHNYSEQTKSHIISAGSPFKLSIEQYWDHQPVFYPAGMGLKQLNVVSDSDTFLPFLSLTADEGMIVGIAGDFEDANLNGVLDTGEDINFNRVLDARTEDINGNGILDEGEDINSDGLINTDTGLNDIVLMESSENVSLVDINYSSDNLRADFELVIIDPFKPTKAIVSSVDVSGNQVTETLSIPGSVITTAESGDDGSSIVVSWTDANSQEDIQNYLVYISEQPFDNVSQATLIKTLEVDVSNITLDGLTPETTYHIAVVAKNYAEQESLVYASQPVLLRGVQFYYSARYGSLRHEYESELTAEFLGENANNAYIHEFVQSSTNQPSSTETITIPAFSIDHIFDIHAINYRDRDEFELKLIFSDEDENFIGELSYIRTSQLGWHINYRTSEGVSTILPGSEEYEQVLIGELSFSNDKIYFARGDGYHGINDFSIDADMSNVDSIAVSASGSLGHADGGFFQAWLGLKHIDPSVIHIDSSYAEVFTADIAVPYPASDVEISTPLGEQLQLSWVEPNVNQNFVEKYLITVNNEVVAEVPATAFTMSNNQKNYTFTLENLPLNQAHFINIITQNLVGNQESSTTTTILMPYTSPPNIRVLEALDGSVQLAWGSHDNTNNIAAYRVYVSDSIISDVADLTPHAELDKDALSTTVEGLNNGQTYFFAVTTVNTDGIEYQQTTSVSAVPLAPPEEVLVTVENNGDGSTILVSWTDTNNPADIQDYLVYVSQQPMEELTPDLLAKTVSDGTGSVVIDGLTVDTTYYITVLARNHSGQTSDVLNSLDMLTTGVQFYLSAAAPNGTAYQAPLTPEFLGENAENAVVQRLRQLNTWNRIEELVIPNFHSQMTFDLSIDAACLGNEDVYVALAFYDINDEYIGRFHIFKPSHAPSWFMQAQYETLAGEVNRYGGGNLGTYSRMRGDLSFAENKIKFQRDPSANGITDFILDADLSNAATIKVSSGVYATYSGGTCGAEAWLSLTSFDPSVSSGYSAKISTVDTTLPYPIKNLSVSVSPTGTAANIHWSSPDSNNNYIDKYLIEINGELIDEVPDSTFDSFEAGKKQFSYSLTDLSLNEIYSINVITRSKVGKQNDGVSTSLITPSPNPDNLTVVLAANNQVKLQWSLPSSTEHIAYYRLYISDSAITDVTDMPLLQNLTNNSSTWTINNLLNNQTYHFAITAVNTSGYEIKQVTSISATPIDTRAPNNVSSLVATTEEDLSVTVSWQLPRINNRDIEKLQVLMGDVIVAELPPQALSYHVANLPPSTAETITIKAVDTAGNENSGVSLLISAPYANPSSLAILAETDSAVSFSWNGFNDIAGIKHYAIYLSGTPLTSVEGLTPHTTINANQQQATINNLVNFQNYYFAVTVVNIHDYENKSVVAIQGTPTVETDGPIINSINYGSQGFSQGFNAGVDQAICVSLTDASPISRAEFYIDEQLVGADSNASDGYCYNINLQTFTDGAHVFEVKAFDVYENTRSQIINFTISLAAPAAPKVLSPESGYITNMSRTDIEIESEPGLDVLLDINGAETQWQPVNATGRLVFDVSLVEGDNTISAKARNRSGEGEFSSPVTVTLDTSLPSQPIGLTAVSLDNGQVRLQWSIDTQAEYTGFNLYRSDAPFEDIASAVKVNNDVMTSTTFNDVLFEDGTYYYRVTSVNDLNTESELSSSVSVVADSTPPIAELIEYTIDGAFDSDTQTYGQGVLNIVLTVNEPLITTPFLSIAPENGAPISVSLVLVAGEEQQYQGAVLLDENVRSGVAYAVFSGRDRYGNRGTNISVGEQINIDTAGPRVTSVVHSPATPIQNDETNPVTVSVTIELDEALPSGNVPTLQYALNHSALDPITINNLNNVVGNQWVGEFVLPSDAGLAQPENLSFSFSATDALGNVGTEIETTYITQVYQGDLPPLAAPFNFRGRPLSEGRVQLDWFAVEDAVAYQLYRKAPDESELVAYQRLDIGDTFIDQTDIDGEYEYSLASIRQDNGQESLSAQSGIVTIVTDSEAPASPVNLTVELFPIGIQTAWDTVAGSNIRYRLYRAESGPILSTAGLTPLLDNLVDPFVVDTQATQQYPAYAVVAVDDYGNESEPSNTAYLNVDLLPVASIKVRVDDASIPQVEWTHSRDTINQFDLYLGQDESGIKLNDSVLTQTSYSDVGYSNNERQYAVVAIDSNDQRSLARNITLPNVEMLVLPNQLIKRNLINAIDVSVTNHSSSAVSNARIKLISPQGIFQSSQVTLAGGATQIVPVSIAGLSSLPDTWDVSLEMHAQPNGGEIVEIATDTQLQVQDGALNLQLETSDFVRGATANIRFELQNTGAEAIQLITARNTGRNDSPDVTFTLVDEDDNVLALSPFRQVVGSNVVTNASAETIASIAAGESWQSPETQIIVPANAPDTVYIVATISNLYANRGLAEQVRIDGPVVRQRIVLQETAYVGTVDSVTPERSFGDETIVIQGQAVDRVTNTPLANVDLTIVVSVSNYERQFNVQTDDLGNYAFNYKPQKGESGSYRISALNPILTTRPTHGTFVINSIRLSPDRLNLNIPYLFDYSLPVTLIAGEGTELTNVHFALRAEDQPTSTLPEGINIQLPSAISISSKQRRSRTLVIQADETAASEGDVFIALFADQSSATPLGIVDIAYNLSQPLPGNVATPIISHTPSVMEMGATLTGVSNRSITLENKGLATLRNVNLSLKTADGFEAPSWIKLVTPQNLGDIEAGESKTIDLLLRPDNAAPVGVAGFNLEVQSSNAQNYLIPVYTSVSESGIGGVLLKVTDMYTGVLNGSGNIIQGLPSAEVRIQNEALPNIEHRLTTDGLGEVFLENLPAGRYSIWVSEPNYQEAHIRVRVQPGLIESEQVFLDYNLINLEWSVDEIAIQDSYQVTLKATFETDVPAAVVMLEPTSIPLPEMDEGDVFYGELTMTNYGLIRAYDIDFTPQESDEFFQFDYLLDVVPESLGPKEVVIIPYKITALKSLEQQDASGGGCGVYNNCSGCSAKSNCPSGVSSTSTSSCVNRSYGSCSSPNSGSSGGRSDASKKWTPTGSPRRPFSYYGRYTPVTGTPPTLGFPVCRDGGAGCGE